MDKTSTHLKENRQSGDPALVESAARLEILLTENEKFAKKRAKNFTAREAQEMALIKNPIDATQAFAVLGLLTGSIPTTAIFLKLLLEGSGGMEPAAMALAIFVVFSVAATSAAGFYSGKLVGQIVSDLERRPWIVMLAALPFVGAVWGLLSGAAGGFILFGFGALVGGTIGGIVGSAVLSSFGVLHRILKKGDTMERSQFIPVAFGITVAVAAFILGL